MELFVLRFSSQTDSTNGLFFEKTDLGLNFLCYTLEDERRALKVRGETRVPEGEYKIQLKEYGGFHERYSKRFGKMHLGMLHILDVPNFSDILIHCGNTDEHTMGCLLLGDSQENNVTKKNGFIGRSATAYRRIYPKIAKACENGEKVIISFIDINDK